MTSNLHTNGSAQDAALDINEILALARLDVKQGNLSAALPKLKALIAREGAPEAAFTVAGVVYMQLELWDRAKQMLERHLNLHPGAPEQTHLLAMSHYQMGHGREALKLWDDLLERFPAAQEALLYRGLQRAQLGLPEEARRDLELLMRVSPADSPLLKGAKEMLHRIDFEFAITRASGRAGERPLRRRGRVRKKMTFPLHPTRRQRCR